MDNFSGLDERKESKKYKKPRFKVGVTLIIVGAVMLAGGAIWAKATNKAMKTQTIRVEETLDADKVKNIIINYDTGEITLEKSSDDKIHVVGDLVEDMFFYEVNGDKFTFTSKQKEYKLFSKVNLKWNSINTTDTKLTISLPDRVYKQMSIDIGVGESELNGLTCEKLDMDFGVGETKVKNFTATKSANIDCGVGEVNFESCKFEKANFDLGVGEIDFEGVLTGECSIDCGVGDASFKIDGSEKDYRLIGDSKYKSGKEDKNCPNVIDISKGIGDIDIDFR